MIARTPVIAFATMLLGSIAACNGHEGSTGNIDGNATDGNATSDTGSNQGSSTLHWTELVSPFTLPAVSNAGYQYNALYNVLALSPDNVIAIENQGALTSQAALTGVSHVYQSTDHGATWPKLATFPSGPPPGGWAYNMYAVGNDIFVGMEHSGDGGMTWNTITGCFADTSSTASVTRVIGVSATDVYLEGNFLLCHVTDGHTGTPITTVPAYTMGGPFFAVAANNIVTEAEGGMNRFDGTTTTSISSYPGSTDDAFTPAIWGSGVDIFTAYDGAHIYHSGDNGLTWELQTTEDTEAGACNGGNSCELIGGLWGTGPTDVYAFGPKIWHYSGGTQWHVVFEPPDNLSLFQITASTPTDVYVSGYPKYMVSATNTGVIFHGTP